MQHLSNEEPNKLQPKSNSNSKLGKKEINCNQTDFGLLAHLARVKKSSRVGFLRSTSFPFFLLFCCNIFLKRKRSDLGVAWQGLSRPSPVWRNAKIEHLQEQKDRRTLTRTERHENTYMNRKTDERLVEMDRFFSCFTFSYFSSFLSCSLLYFDYFARFSDLTFSVLWSFFSAFCLKTRKKLVCYWGTLSFLSFCFIVLFRVFVFEIKWEM